MPAGAEADRNLALIEKVPGAHDIIDAVDLMVDMLHAGMIGREQGNAVMHLIEG